MTPKDKSANIHLPSCLATQTALIKIEDNPNLSGPIPASIGNLNSLGESTVCINMYLKRQICSY